MNSKITTAILLLSFLLFSCKTITNHGRNISDDDLSTLIEGATDKKEVLFKLGSPTVQDKSGDVEEWYYSSITKEKRAFFTPVITERKIYNFKFDKDLLVKISKLETENNNFNADNKVTPAKGPKVNHWKEYISKLGAFRKKNNKKKDW